MPHEKGSITIRASYMISMHSFWAKYVYILGSETFTGWVVRLGAGISKHEGREQDV